MLVAKKIAGPASYPTGGFTVNEGGTSTYTIGGEVAAATDLSGVTFYIIADGS